MTEYPGKDYQPLFDMINEMSNPTIGQMHDLIDLVKAKYLTDKPE